MKTMETKYNKLIESKLKLIDNNIKAQEKIQKNKEEIKKKSEEIYSFFFYFILIFAIIEKKAVIKWIHQK